MTENIVGTSIVASFLIGFLIGVIFMDIESNKNFDKILIQRNLKEYDEKTGELIWIDDFSLKDSQRSKE